MTARYVDLAAHLSPAGIFVRRTTSTVAQWICRVGLEARRAGDRTARLSRLRLHKPGHGGSRIAGRDGRRLKPFLALGEAHRVRGLQGAYLNQPFQITGAAVPGAV